MPSLLHLLSRGAGLALLAAATAALLACANVARLPPGWPSTLETLLPTDVLLLGEQHDAPEHQAMQRAAVQWLAERGVLASVVMEMAPAGGSTAPLAASANQAQVRAALQWDERLWPWKSYSAVVMAAVRAGVPVLGGNLPRAAMAAARQDAALDQALPEAARAAQLDAVREGHCGLLPEEMLPGMVRIQIARDQSMARTVVAAPRPPGQTVLLIAGSGHVLRSRGVPVHLPHNLSSKVALALTGKAQAAIELEADLASATAPVPVRDNCAPLRAPRP